MTINEYARLKRTESGVSQQVVADAQPTTPPNNPNQPEFLTVGHLELINQDKPGLFNSCELCTGDKRSIGEKLAGVEATRI